MRDVHELNLNNGGRPITAPPPAARQIAYVEGAAGQRTALTDSWGGSTLGYVGQPCDLRAGW